MTFSTTNNSSWTYLWFKDGSGTVLSTNNTLTLTNISTAQAGQYCVVVAERFGCPPVTNCAFLNLSGTIGNFVWHDLNRNGIQDAGEPGLGNVTVRLLDCASNLLATTNTDAGGAYLFSRLPAGNYRIAFTAPPGFVFTLPDVGNDATDSDANPTNGLTPCFALATGEVKLTVDAGLVPPSCPA